MTLKYVVVLHEVKATLNLMSCQMQCSLAKHLNVKILLSEIRTYAINNTRVAVS